MKMINMFYGFDFSMKFNSFTVDFVSHKRDRFSFIPFGFMCNTRNTETISKHEYVIRMKQE